MIKNYVRGIHILIGAVETSKKIQWFLTRITALGIVSKALAEVDFIDELRGLEISEQKRAALNNADDEVDDSLIGEVKHSIIQTKLSRGQLFEADWEAHKAEPLAPYASINIIRHKIEQGPLQWKDALDSIAYLDNAEDRFMLLCELAEVALTIRHADGAHFFKLVHDAIKEVIIPEEWSSDPAPHTHPLAPLASLYAAANKHDYYVEFLKGLPQPDHDVLLSYAIGLWRQQDMDTKKLLTFTDEIEHRLEKASTLSEIAYLEAVSNPESAREILRHAEQLVDEAHDEPELHDFQREMVAGEIMKVRLELGDEEFVDTYLMDEKE
ncbi:MAG: hypothetical protein AAB400_03905, partial [Patescibacteria group bacterium]